MLRQRYCFCILCAALAAAIAYLLLLAPQQARAQDPPPQKGPVSFINDVAPVLKSCFICHDSKKRKGKLDLTSYEAMRKGGDNEDPIVPGKPDESYLISVLTTTTGKRMPPKDAGEPLKKEQIAVIEKWIQEGAKLDAGIAANADLARELRIRWKPPQPPVAYKFPWMIHSLAFTPDNQKLVASGHHELTIWDFATGKLEKRIYTRAERNLAMLFLPDGKLAVAGGRPGQEGDVRIYDINGGNPKMVEGVAILDGVNDKAVLLKELVQVDDEIRSLALSADGKKLAAGGCDRLVRVWDLSPGIADANLEQTIENHADWVLGVAFSPDGHYLWTASRDKSVKVWDLDKKESAVTFPDHQQPVSGVTVKQVSDKQALGFSVGEDNNLRSWNFTIGADKDGNKTTEGKQRAASGGHSKAVLKVALHPAKPILVTCSGDTTVRIWNPDNGAAVKTLAGHTDHVFAIAISPDANLIASGAYNGEVRIWKVADGSLVKSFNASPGVQQAAAPPQK